MPVRGSGISMIPEMDCAKKGLMSVLQPFAAQIRGFVLRKDIIANEHVVAKHRLTIKHDGGVGLRILIPLYLKNPVRLLVDLQQRVPCLETWTLAPYGLILANPPAADSYACCSFSIRTQGRWVSVGILSQQIPMRRHFEIESPNKHKFIFNGYKAARPVCRYSLGGPGFMRQRVDDAPVFPHTSGGQPHRSIV